MKERWAQIFQRQQIIQNVFLLLTFHYGCMWHFRNWRSLNYRRKPREAKYKKWKSAPRVNVSTLGLGNTFHSVLSLMFVYLAHACITKVSKVRKIRELGISVLKCILGYANWRGLSKVSVNYWPDVPANASSNYYSSPF